MTHEDPKNAPAWAHPGGRHLLVEIWGAKRLNDADWVISTLCRAAEAANATVLHTHAHQFSPSGISGVVVLAESHITIHTWPDQGYAAVDIFMCGECNPHDALSVLRGRFFATSLEVTEHQRGRPRLGHRVDVAPTHSRYPSS